MSMNRVFISLIIITLFFLPAKAQKKKTSVNTLKTEQANLKKQIKANEQQLSANEKDVNKRLKNLIALNTEIAGKKDSIKALKQQVDAMNRDITKMGNQLSTLQRELSDKKDKYVKSLRYMHRNRSVQDRMMFIFSAKNFSQMYRRMRFMREYATYQRVQGEEVKTKEAQVERKRNELIHAKTKVAKLVQKGEDERMALEKKQGEQQKAVKGLKNKQKEIKQLITKQKKRDDELNRQIDKLIAEEIARSQKKNDTSSGEAKGSAASSGGFKMSAEDIRLSTNFESNKGKLPIPITGQYRIVSSFGTYDVEGLKGVRLDNKGINIEGKAGAQARAIFDGEVSAVFSFGGTTGVMVRHGSYISVYCNLAKASVKKGQKVSTKQVLGTLTSDNTLQFQLRKEKTKLNPELWLIR